MSATNPPRHKPEPIIDQVIKEMEFAQNHSLNEMADWIVENSIPVQWLEQQKYSRRWHKKISADIVKAVRRFETPLIERCKFLQVQHLYFQAAFKAQKDRENAKDAVIKSLVDQIRNLQLEVNTFRHERSERRAKKRKRKK